MEKLLLLVPIILISACVQQTADEQVISSCIQLCEQEKIKRDLGNGPCLSNEIIKDWVCDVAHSPRLDVDNLPDNQCSAFREGLANHFVEVDTSCKFIKKY